MEEKAKKAKEEEEKLKLEKELEEQQKKEEELKVQQQLEIQQRKEEEEEKRKVQHQLEVQKKKEEDDLKAQQKVEQAKKDEEEKQMKETEESERTILHKPETSKSETKPAQPMEVKSKTPVTKAEPTNQAVESSEQLKEPASLLNTWATEPSKASRLSEDPTPKKVKATESPVTRSEKVGPEVEVPQASGKKVEQKGSQPRTSSIETNGPKLTQSPSVADKKIDSKESHQKGSLSQARTTETVEPKAPVSQAKETNNVEPKANIQKPQTPPPVAKPVQGSQSVGNKNVLQVEPLRASVPRPISQPAQRQTGVTTSKPPAINPLTSSSVIQNPKQTAPASQKASRMPLNHSKQRVIGAPSASTLPADKRASPTPPVSEKPNNPAIPSGQIANTLAAKEQVPKKEEQVQQRPFIHARHKCDNCNAKPIIGKRYHAVYQGANEQLNVDYDLCEICIKKPQKYYANSKELQFEVQEDGKSFLFLV